MDNSRRSFLKKLGLGSVAVVGTAVVGDALNIKEEVTESIKVPEGHVEVARLTFDTKTGEMLASKATRNYEPTESSKKWQLERKLSDSVDSLIRKMELKGINQDEYQLLIDQHKKWMDVVEDLSFPSIAFNYFWIGKAHYKFGNQEKMMETFNQFLNSNVSGSTFSKYCIEIGDMMFELGNNTDAIRFYEFARFKVPNAPVKRKIAKCLVA